MPRSDGASCCGTGVLDRVDGSESTVDGLGWRDDGLVERNGVAGPETSERRRRGRLVAAGMLLSVTSGGISSKAAMSTTPNSGVFAGGGMVSGLVIDVAGSFEPPAMWQSYRRDVAKILGKISSQINLS